MYRGHQTHEVSVRSFASGASPTGHIPQPTYPPGAHSPMFFMDLFHSESTRYDPMAECGNIDDRAPTMQGKTRSHRCVRSNRCVTRRERWPASGARAKELCSGRSEKRRAPVCTWRFAKALASRFDHLGLLTRIHRSEWSDLCPSNNRLPMLILGVSVVRQRGLSHCIRSQPGALAHVDGK